MRSWEVAKVLESEGRVMRGGRLLVDCVKSVAFRQSDLVGSAIGQSAMVA